MENEHAPVYCLRCKEKTPNVNEKIVRKIVPHLKCQCSLCFTNKSTYLKHEEVIEDSTSEESSSGNETSEAPTNSRRKII